MDFLALDSQGKCHAKLKLIYTLPIIVGFQFFGKDKMSIVSIFSIKTRMW